MKKILFFVVMLVCLNDGIAQNSKSVEIENSLLKLVVDKSSRTWSLFENMFNTWKPIVSNASISLTFANGDSLNLITETGEIGTKIGDAADAIGNGKSLTVRSTGSFAEWNLTFRLYELKKILSVSARIKNLSHDSWKTKELHLVDIGGAGYLAFKSNTVLMQTNGYQSWSNCEIVALDSVAPKTSYWSAVFSEPDAFSSILFGFITNGSAVNSFHVGPLDFSSSTVHGVSNSDIKTLAVPPGEEIHSDTMIISAGVVAIDLLQTYGEYLQTFAPSVNKAFTPNGKEPTRREGISSMPTGWCSWYYYYQNISEDSILTNLNVAARSLKEAGLQYIQIDDGYQVAAGDWNTNKKFPHGHKWLVDQIHGKGLLAGLWLAPFAIAESSTVYKHHRDWLLKDDGDTLKQFSANDWWGGKIYSLDPTKPEVQRWLSNLFYMIVNTWGYDYVKIDFLYFAGEGGKYWQPVSSAQAYRMGLQAIRRGVRSNTFILGCGAPMGSSVGYVDGMRIGGDVYASWDGVTPCVNAAAQRFFYHNTVWYNDPDCLVVRDPLTIDQARAWASVVALSGQMDLLSDKLPALPSERIDLLRMTLPGYGREATPEDLFSQPRDEGLELRTSDGHALNLPRIWKIAVGDSLAWKESSFNDNEWKHITLPSHWEDEGFPNVDGYVWYRGKFVLPSTWIKGPLTFSFGKIDDCDETFVNGISIGKTGEFPPDYNSAWTAFRTYSIPREIVRWDSVNTIAVRVYDGGGPGGIYNIQPTNLPAIWNLPVVKSFERWNVVGLFNWTSEKKAVTIKPLQLGLSKKKTYLLYELWADQFLGEFSGDRTLTISPTSSNILTIHEKTDRPVILSTSRHIVQGAIDLVNEEWDKSRMTLSVTAEKLLKGSYSIVLYVPEGLDLKQVQSRAVHEEQKLPGSIYKITFPHLSNDALAFKILFR